MKVFKLSKNPLKNILSIVAAVLVIALLIGGLVALFGRDTRTIGPGEFTRGKLDAEGKYVEYSTAIYTEEAFLCQGLRIVPDFEASGKFDVYFYDANDRYMGSAIGLTEVYEADFPEASRARVVYYPDKPDDVKASDWTIGLLEVRKYAKQLTITVDREQTEYKSSSDLYVEANTVGAFTSANINELDNTASVQASELIQLDGSYDYYRVYVCVNSVSSVDAQVMFGNADDKAICIDDNGREVVGVAYTFSAKDLLPGSWYSCIVEVPDAADSLRVQGPVDAEFRIYGVEAK